MESGHRSDSGICIHGTVVANTDSWVFFILFKTFVKIPTYVECRRVILKFGGNWYEGKQNNKKQQY